MKLQKEAVLSYDNFKSLSYDIIELAKEILPDKVIYINFLNDNVQVTMRVSKHDTDVNVFEGETIPVEEAVCNNIDYKSGKPLIFEDIKENKFNEKINQTIKNGNLGSYLGIPIVYRNGQRFGALCAAHHDKSAFDQNDIELLGKIANLFSYYLELERQALIDSLTGLGNTRLLSSKKAEITENGGLVIMLDLDNFKQVNDTLGHHVGDLVLKEMGEKISQFADEFNSVDCFRLGGDEFFIYIKENMSENKTIEALNKLINTLKEWTTNIENIGLSSSAGAYQFDNNHDNNFTSIYKKVDSLLYQAKDQGKGTFVFEKSL